MLVEGMMFFFVFDQSDATFLFLLFSCCLIIGDDSSAFSIRYPIIIIIVNNVNASISYFISTRDVVVVIPLTLDHENEECMLLCR